MAKGKPRLNDDPGWLETCGLGRQWNNELCAEHDGTIASFKRLREPLKDLAEYKQMLDREKINMARVGKVAAGMAGGVALVTPMALAAGPALASSLGASGLLGAAGTGTAISNLSGAALTSASLAAIGGGTMATGLAVVTAVGAGLGALEGGLLVNSYVSEIKHFEITKCNDGQQASLLFLDGFLCQKKPCCDDWLSGTGDLFAGRRRYHLQWESGLLYKIGATMRGPAASSFCEWMRKGALRASKKAGSKLSPITWAAALLDIARNPWHRAMVRAQMTGAVLADLLARTQNQKFTLVGHSLGCRVLFYALNALSTRATAPVVEDVYLLGGAVDKNDQDGWDRVCKAVSGRIYNCYSRQDAVLNYLYRISTAFVSDPVGRGPISCSSDKVANVDVSDLVDGHMEYRKALGKVLARAQDAA